MTLSSRLGCVDTAHLYESGHTNGTGGVSPRVGGRRSRSSDRTASSQDEDGWERLVDRRLIRHVDVRWDLPVLSGDRRRGNSASQGE